MNSNIRIELFGKSLFNRFVSTNKFEKKNLWQRIRYVMNIYWQGTKLLYRNSQLIKEIKKKNENDRTRLENEFSREYFYDIRVGIPFVTLFALPIIGYSAPLIALLNPKSLPSTFILPEQKRKFVVDDAKSSSKIIESLIEWNRKRVDHHQLSSNLLFIEFDQKIKSLKENEIKINEIVEMSRLFSLSMKLEYFPKEHLKLLHQSVLHSSLLSQKIFGKEKLIFDLELWQWNIFQSDRMINNVNQLENEDLVLSLYHRGIYFHLDSMLNLIENNQMRRFNNKIDRIKIDERILNDWKEILHQWIFIHRELVRHNSISTSFLLHLFPLIRFHSNFHQ